MSIRIPSYFINLDSGEIALAITICIFGFVVSSICLFITVKCVSKLTNWLYAKRCYSSENSQSLPEFNKRSHQFLTTNSNICKRCHLSHALRIAFKNFYHDTSNCNADHLLKSNSFSDKLNVSSVKSNVLSENSNELFLKSNDYSGISNGINICTINRESIRSIDTHSESTIILSNEINNNSVINITDIETNKLGLEEIIISSNQNKSENTNNKVDICSITIDDPAKKQYINNVEIMKCKNNFINQKQSNNNFSLNNVNSKNLNSENIPNYSCLANCFTLPNDNKIYSIQNSTNKIRETLQGCTHIAFNSISDAPQIYNSSCIEFKNCSTVNNNNMNISQVYKLNCSNSNTLSTSKQLKSFNYQRLSHNYNYRHLIHCHSSCTHHLYDKNRKSSLPPHLNGFVSTKLFPVNESFSSELDIQADESVDTPLLSKQVSSECGEMNYDLIENINILIEGENRHTIILNQC